MSSGRGNRSKSQENNAGINNKQNEIGHEEVDFQNIVNANLRKSKKAGAQQPLNFTNLVNIDQ